MKEGGYQYLGRKLKVTFQGPDVTTPAQPHPILDSLSWFHEYIDHAIMVTNPRRLTWTNL